MGERDGRKGGRESLEVGERKTEGRAGMSKKDLKWERERQEEGLRRVTDRRKE